MLPEPAITCVIPTYRRPRLLRRAIRSVLDQSFPDFELCIYDNASGDETGQVVKSLAAGDSRVRYHCHPENIGTQNNFIFGLARARSPFVHFISDDDFLMPGFFARAVDALERESAAAFFSGGILSAEGDGRVRGLLGYGSAADITCRPPRLFSLLAPYTPTWTSALFRRCAIERLGGLKKETGYSFAIDLILRAAARFAAVLTETPYAVFTVHSESSSVAEAPEVFDSLLSLSYFDSISEAIEAAFTDGIVTGDEASAMKRQIRKLTITNIYRGGLAMIVRRHTSIANRAAKILSAYFGRQDLALMIKFGAIDNICGGVVRGMLCAAKRIRDQRLQRNRQVGYTAYTEIVKARMLQLDS